MENMWIPIIGPIMNLGDMREEFIPWAIASSVIQSVCLYNYINKGQLLRNKKNFSYFISPSYQNPHLSISVNF